MSVGEYQHFDAIKPGRTSQQATYPGAFATPEGRFVTIGAMKKALATIHENPDAEYTGWDAHAVPGHIILAAWRRGLHARINQRALQQPAQARPPDSTPYWQDGEPANLHAAACDALEWLNAILRQPGPVSFNAENRNRLTRCRALLAAKVYP